jgi:hypothetical protein
MAHLKQHTFNDDGLCIGCGVNEQDEESALPCDHASAAADDYFAQDDPRWQEEQSA